MDFFHLPLNITAFYDAGHATDVHLSHDETTFLDAGHTADSHLPHPETRYHQASFTESVNLPALQKPIGGPIASNVGGDTPPPLMPKEETAPAAAVYFTDTATNNSNWLSSMSPGQYAERAKIVSKYEMERSDMVKSVIAVTCILYFGGCTLLSRAFGAVQAAMSPGKHKEDAVQDMRAMICQDEGDGKRESRCSLTRDLDPDEQHAEGKRLLQLGDSKVDPPRVQIPLKTGEVQSPPGGEVGLEKRKNDLKGDAGVGKTEMRQTGDAAVEKTDKGQKGNVVVEKGKKAKGEAVVQKEDKNLEGEAGVENGERGPKGKSTVHKGKGKTQNKDQWKKGNWMKGKKSKGEGKQRGKSHKSEFEAHKGRSHVRAAETADTQ